jgi:hypothetical protein
MVILLEIDESKGGGSALPDQDPLACFFRQRTGKGVPVGKTSEALLEQLSEFVDMEGLVCFSQYLNGEVNEGLTSFSPPMHGRRFSIRASPELADSTQLIVELKFKDLQQDFLEILFVHGRHLPKDNEY